MLKVKNHASLASHVSQETELLAAGFPCIDVSRAGLRQGLQGKVRTALHIHLMSHRNAQSIRSCYATSNAAVYNPLTFEPSEISSPTASRAPACSTTL